MRLFKNYIMREKLFALILGFVLLGTLFVPAVEQRATDELEVEDDQPDDSGDSVSPDPMRNAVLSGLGETVQLSDNSYTDLHPQIDAGQVTWYGSDGLDYEVFLYDGVSTVQLTNNSFDDMNPQIDAGQVTWCGWVGPGVLDSEIFLYDGVSTIQLTDNSVRDVDPQIDAGQVTWERYDGSDWEIFLYNGTNTIQLTDNSVSDMDPQIDAGQVAWTTAGGVGFYNGTTTTLLTADSLPCYDPQIDAGQVVWWCPNGSSYYIYLYNGTTTIQLAQYPSVAWHQQIDAGYVTWEAMTSLGSNTKIFLYDGVSTIQLTDNWFREQYPQINAGHVTWWGGPNGPGNEIYLYNGTSVTQLTINSFGDFHPEIDAGQVTWYGDDGSDNEIFLHTYAIPPDPPLKPYVQQGILHNYLTWNEPNDNGASITQYNIYRGEVENGTKTHIGSSSTTSYNDTAVNASTMYYYVVTAENIAGEGLPSEEESGMPRDVPFLVWKEPTEGEEIVFPVGDAVFHFRYDWGEIDYVELVINGTNFGDVTGKNSTVLSPYTVDIDGRVEAVLNGYIEGVLFVSDSRNFTFAKLTVDVEELIDSKQEYLGRQLYMILHDPNGDNSFSGFTRELGLSLGVGASLSVTVGWEGKVGIEDLVPGVDAGFSRKLTFKAGGALDWRWEITQTTELTSSKDSSDKDYIGPGYGDTYWGEAWTCVWTMKVHNREYFNETQKYEEPKVYYQIIRSHEVILGDYNAPPEWRAQNPVHNNWSDVDWWDNRTIVGGRPYTFTQDVTSSVKKRIEFGITMEDEYSLKVFKVLEMKFLFSIEFQVYKESEIKKTYTTTHTIEDDESSDIIEYEYGIDQVFGTPIFRPTPVACRTSYPLEHNTFDYLPPIIQFPSVNYDTSLDGLAPCKDDQPLIMVRIFDEGGISSALIRYSLNEGTNWDSAILEEQVANPGTWQGSIPAMDHGTTVLWYIQVWDLEGSESTRMNPNGLPYRYTVANRAPSIEILSPVGAESYLDTIRIAWSASDVDDDELTYTLSYNIADTGWRLLASGVSGSYYDWDISDLPYSETVLVKVVADDGFGGSAFDVCDYVFTIGTPPEGAGEPFMGLALVGGAVLIGTAVAVGVYLSRRSPIIVD